MRKTLTAAVVAASMLGGAGAGIALSSPVSATAQSGQSSSVAASAVPAAAAAVDAAATQAATPTAPQWMTDELKKLVDAGTINQSQADAVAAALAAAQPAHGPGGPGFGHGPHEMGDDLAIAAKAIGISDADLQTALQSGQSLAAVAKAHNVDPQKVIDALVADEEAELADQVKNGQLTQAQADQMKTNVVQHVTDRVNGVGGGPHGHGRGRGPAGDSGSNGSNGTSGSSTTTTG